MKNKKVKTETVVVGKYPLIKILSKPPRIEAKIDLHRDYISQKLVFKLMEISHSYGFGCSSPIFAGEDNSVMAFFIGTIIFNSRNYDNILENMNKCMTEIEEFVEELHKQLDFSTLDISMFSEVDFEDFYPEHIAAVRDQLHNGSWDSFIDEAYKDEDNEYFVHVISKCMEFEEANKKDIGYVGNALWELLKTVNNQFNANETN